MNVAGVFVLGEEHEAWTSPKSWGSGGNGPDRGLHWGGFGRSGSG